MVAPAAAAALLKALGTKAAVKSTKQFADGMKSMQKTSKDGGLDAFKDGMDKMGNFATSFQPIAVPFQMMSTKFAAATTESSIKLMNSMMELLETETVQNGINLLIDMVNGITTGAAAMVEAAADVTMENLNTQMGNMGMVAGDANDATTLFGGALERLGQRLRDERLAVEELEEALRKKEALRIIRYTNALDGSTGSTGYQDF